MIRLCGAALCIYLPVLHLLNATHNLPTFTTRYLFNHAFVKVKDCLFASESNTRTSCVSTDTLRLSWDPQILYVLLTCFLLTDLLPKRPKSQKLLKKPDCRRLDNTPGSCPPFSACCLFKDAQGLSLSLPHANVHEKNTSEGEWKV